LLLGWSASGQEDTIAFAINELPIDIVSSIAMGTPANDKNEISVAQQLTKYGPWTVRNGGPSQLSTILSRGYGSRHVGILWSGFNIQSVVNGTYDVGLITNSFDRISVLSHDVNGSIGNASVVGALSLENRLNNTSFSLLSRFGSDQNIDIQGVSDFKKGKYAHHLGLTIKRSPNKYDYKFGNDKERQSLARMDLYDLNYSAKLSISQKISLEGKAWLQHSERMVPVSKTSAPVDQDQTDTNYRYALSGNYAMEESNLKLRVALFDEYLGYFSPGIFSEAFTDVLNAAIDYNFKSDLKISLQYRNDQVSATFFNTKRNRRTISLFGQYGFDISGFRVQVMARPQLVDEELKLASLGATVKKQIGEHNVFFIYNRGLTLPSFNDLYWPSGGNPDLEEETSHNFEAGYKRKFSFVDIQWSTYFNSIDNWIQWTPIAGQFSPVNQRKVRNVGTEITLNRKDHWAENLSMNTSVNYAFIDSRIVDHDTDKSIIGKKAIFIPRHKWSATIALEYGAWSAMVNPYYYSKRYNTVDNTSFTDGYFVTDVSLQKDFNINNKYNLSTALAIENATSTDYEHVRFFAMPLRVFRATIRLTIK